ncbi:MAG: hypothetical protein AB7H92_16500 [Microbacteriaceae bacterium]
MNDLDQRFFRAIAVGAVAGTILMWASLTAVFAILTDQRLLDVAGLALVPGLFCGPFFGGLITTAAVHDPTEEAEALELHREDIPRAA